jgi:hypothetical protein
LPITLDKNTLCTNIPSNITAKLEKVWRKVLYQKKLYLPMTIGLAVPAAHAIPIDLLLNDSHVDKKSCSFDFVVEELENLWVL